MSLSETEREDFLPLRCTLTGEKNQASSCCRRIESSQQEMNRLKPRRRRGRIGARTRSGASTKGRRTTAEESACTKGPEESFTETEIETENFDISSGTGDTTSSQGAIYFGGS